MVQANSYGVSGQGNEEIDYDKEGFLDRYGIQKRSGNSRADCCLYSLMVSQQKSKVIPLSDVKIEINTLDALVVYDCELKYANPSSKPIECTYEFPVDK